MLGCSAWDGRQMGGSIPLSDRRVRHLARQIKSSISFADIDYIATLPHFPGLLNAGSK